MDRDGVDEVVDVSAVERWRGRWLWLILVVVGLVVVVVVEIEWRLSGD